MAELLLLPADSQSVLTMRKKTKDCSHHLRWVSKAAQVCLSASPSSPTEYWTTVPESAGCPRHRRASENLENSIIVFCIEHLIQHMNDRMHVFIKTFNEDVMRRILRCETPHLHVLLFALSVLLLDPSRAAMTDFLFYSFQTLVEIVSMQEASQLILRELTRALQTRETRVKNNIRIYSYVCLSNRTSGGLWYSVRRLLLNSFISFKISCLTSGGMSENSSE